MLHSNRFLSGLDRGNIDALTVLVLQKYVGRRRRVSPEEAGNDSFTENSPSLLGSFGELGQLFDDLRFVSLCQDYTDPGAVRAVPFLSLSLPPSPPSAG